jgi:Mg/Co/Ni transporter MgtE
MQPRTAAAVVVALPVEHAADLLERIGQQPSVVLLRHVEEPRRTRLIEALPTATALATRLLLGYPDDSVGACVNPNVVVVLATQSVGDVLERVRNLDVPVQEVFIVDDSRQLLGWARLDALLRTAESGPIGGLLLSATAVLTANMPLAGALEHPGWEFASRLPVVERGERLVGVLTRDALVRAVARANRGANSDPLSETLAGVLVSGYWQSVAGMIESLTVVLPRVEPIGDYSNER